MAKVAPKRMHFVNRFFSVLPNLLLAFLFFSGAVNNKVQDQFGRKAVFWSTRLTNEEIAQMSLKHTYWNKLSVCLDIPYYQQENRSIKNPKTIPKKSQVANISFNRHSSALLPFVLAFFLCGPVNTNVQEHYGQSTVLWNHTKLTFEEITRTSVVVGPDWDKLAAVMDIPYYLREEIRLYYSNYPSFYLKAEQVFLYLNERKSLTRHDLNKFFKELGRYDLENEVMPVENQSGSDKEENVQLQKEDSRFDNNDKLHLRNDTPLSSREMYKLSLHIPYWNTLAALLNISSTERNDIRNSSSYPDNRSQAEKILWIFNNREDFSREKLTHGLKEISLPQLIKPVINGEWRSSELKHEEREEQLESGLKPEDHRQKFKAPERIPKKAEFARNRRFSLFPRFLLAFLLSSVVNTNIPEKCDEKPILWNTELTSDEITRMSEKVGADWDKLAGLMDIPYSQREEIRLNYSKYPSLPSKAEQVFVHFNKSRGFNRHALRKFFKELGRHDLEIELISVGNQTGLKREGIEEQFENGLKPKDHREQFKIAERTLKRTNFERIPSNRRLSVFPRFLLAFLLSSAVNNSIQLNYDEKPILWNTELTSEEIIRMSKKVGADWYKLAGLMDIPYILTDEIRFNHPKYPNLAAKAEHVFVHFNKSKGFSRYALKTIFKELGRHDLEIELISVGNQIGTDIEESASSQNECSVYESSDKPYLRDDILLSPREICKLGGDIADSWYTLAGLLNISFEARNDIRNNVFYHDNRSRAEKIISIFNNREDFSRQKLANFLKEISQPQLANPVMTGEWRNVIPKRKHFAHIRCNRNFPALLRLVLAVFLGSAVNNNVQDHDGEKPVFWNTKLSNEEITGISLKVGADWDELAGLMNIPYNKREEIRFSISTFSSKAKQILLYYNVSEVFSRHDLKKIFKELGRYDLEIQMVSLENQSGNNRTENASTRSECSIYENRACLEDTTLSSREICRLSKKIVDWYSLAGFMNMTSAERNKIRNNNLYYDDRSRAEKILSIFNNREDFSREKLASLFEETSELLLKNMVETGALRSI